MDENAVCTSCGTPLQETGNTKFKCPKCGRADIGRCPKCRDQSVKYQCAECGFEGP